MNQIVPNWDPSLSIFRLQYYIEYFKSTHPCRLERLTTNNLPLPINPIINLIFTLSLRD